MSKLERWLPFRFRHDESGESKKGAVGKAVGVPTKSESAGGGIAPWGRSPLHQVMSSFFDDPFFREPFRGSSGLERWFGDFSPTEFAPSLEVAEEEKALRITAELPGMAKKDVHLHLDNGSLVVSGEKKSEDREDEEGVYRNERFYGYFQRTIPLPEDVDREKAEATFEDGVLTVRLPKVESPAQSRTIEIG